MPRSQACSVPLLVKRRRRNTMASQERRPPVFARSQTKRYLELWGSLAIANGNQQKCPILLGLFDISGCRAGLHQLFFMPVLVRFAGSFHSPRSCATADVACVNDHCSRSRAREGDVLYKHIKFRRVAGYELFLEDELFAKATVRCPALRSSNSAVEPLKTTNSPLISWAFADAPDGE